MMDNTGGSSSRPPSPSKISRPSSSLAPYRSAAAASSPTSPSSLTLPLPQYHQHQQQQQQQQQLQHGRPSSPLFPPRPPPLHLTIRFSASLPDLQLDILHPDETTVVSLKHLIRSRLPDSGASHRLRFIHAGKILPDAAVLSAVLKAPPPPPRADARRSGPGGSGFAADNGGAGGSGSGGGSDDPKGKGKNVEGRPSAATQRVYVNCSIGDVLSGPDLEAEARAAATPAPSPGTTSSARDRFSRRGAGTAGGVGGLGGGGATGPAASSTGLSTGPTAQQQHGGSISAAPRGFERLLTAGFTAAEVNQLRLQFRSIHAARHTPDTMPSPDTLRGMEDAWIDNNDAGSNQQAGGGGGTEDGGGTSGGDEGFGVSGLADVLVKGMAIGFLFPLGSVGWLIREEGLWSSRWQVFVSFGFILSLTIGMIRSISGDR